MRYIMADRVRTASSNVGIEFEILARVEKSAPMQAGMLSPRYP